MPLHIQRGLGLIGFALLLGFVGLVWTANLFGVADEHARRIARGSFTGCGIGYLIAPPTD
ncbi:hypothetical protein GCM10010169_50100 [Micromonospora fulviviridis]|uniref:hypothetical protein n=1 Tax=Micromonospora fulviviridis TaxID=47860 RepID=UPI00166C2389|nr:hypothetical protein [Micromonospora fulviviridis]GGR99462.1 hypothetical protein GCM10010169_50100 [Micromonospora fulviviridis]